MSSMKYAVVPDTVFVIRGAGELYDVANARIVRQDMRIKCARSAHEDSSIYIYIHVRSQSCCTAFSPQAWPSMTLYEVLFLTDRQRDKQQTHRLTDRVTH